MIPKEPTQHDLDQHDKIQAEIARLIAEISKINRENRCYPAIVGASTTLAIIAVVKFFQEKIKKHARLVEYADAK